MPGSRVLVLVLIACALTRDVAGQQRPLTTEDPESIGAGRLLIEGGLDMSVDQQYPASGLQGTLWRIPSLGVSIGISSIAELQIDGGFYNRLSIKERQPAPLSGMLTVEGDTTSDVEDVVIGTKIRLMAEGARRPSLGFRFATKLPNAENESGLGLDTTDFYTSLLGAKTVQSLRIVGNIGLGILGDPVVGHRQNDVLTYGASFARALTDRAEVVGEVNGRVSTRSGEVPPGTETQGRVNLGGRYTTGAFRLDGSIFFGLTSLDPSVGFTVGATYVIRAFEVP
jgi:hypothetical protein